MESNGNTRWMPARYDPAHWERDLVIAVIVRAAKDCMCLCSADPEAHTAYQFLMDDTPWDIIGCYNVRDTIRSILNNPATTTIKVGLADPDDAGFLQLGIAEILDTGEDYGPDHTHATEIHFIPGDWWDTAQRKWPAKHPKGQGEEATPVQIGPWPL